MAIAAFRAVSSGLGSLREPLTVYTNGSHTNNGKLNASCGGGIWISENNPLNKDISIPGAKHSNQIDSKYVIDGLTMHLKNWEDIGWIGIDNAELFQATAYHLRRRQAPTSFQWTKGHNGTIALTGAVRQTTDTIDTYVPRNFEVQGARLQEITQKLAYKAIMNKSHLEYKLQAVSNSHKDISKKIQTFLIGETELMEHILTQLWNLAKKIWPTKHSPWPDPNIGVILGCGSLSIPNPPRSDNAPIKGASRLLRILVSESAYLIWTLRCERVIQEITHSEEYIQKRWLNAIDRRLQIDRAIAYKTRRDLKSTIKVRLTWSDIINNTKQNQYQDDWVTNPEVLAIVGITLPGPRRPWTPGRIRVPHYFTDVKCA
ncbi:hypothetical protein EDD22DRAFT_979909 [Suillus occidentalis]|nr:hypothetical protein EDD22DRAFT_979909 [Suillus occidentalis]